MIGVIGVVLTMSGLFGSILGGVLLDKTKAFKYLKILILKLFKVKYIIIFIRKVSLIFYLISLASMIIFTLTLQINVWIILFTVFLLG